MSKKNPNRIPKVNVVDDGLGHKEIELSDDPDAVVPLNATNLPISVTVFKVN